MMMMMMMMIKNLYCSLCKVPVIPVTFQLKFNILDRFGKNTQSNLMKICPVVAELLHGDRATGRQGDRATGRQGDRTTGRQGDRATDRHNEANSRFSQFCEGA